MIAPTSNRPVRQPFAAHRTRAVLGACLLAALASALAACSRDPSASAKKKRAFWWSCSAYPGCKQTYFDNKGQPDFSKGERA